MTDSLLDALAKPPPPPSELDELMSRDPLELSAQDIDKIIQFQRQARARREAGPKTKRATKDSPDSGIDLVALVKGTTPASTPTITKPSTGGGFRRI
jgi:hypothetical protein